MRRTLIALAAALLIAGCIGGGGDQSPEATETGDDDTDIRSGTVQINYTSSGFSPQQVTVAPGTTVTWVNQGDVPMWVASDVHPTHAEYDGTSLREHCQDGGGTPFDSCLPRDRYSFVFSETGTHGYHNHERAAHTGTIVVEQP